MPRRSLSSRLLITQSRSAYRSSAVRPTYTGPSRIPGALRMNTWTCSVCNNIMQLVPRTPQSSGQPHAVQAATTSLPATSDSTPEAFLRASPEQCICTVCSCTIEQGSQTSHSAEEQHPGNLEPGAETSSSETGTR